MSSVVEHLKGQLLNLSSGERVELAHFLLSSLDPEEDGAEAAWDAEASRRVTEIRAGRATGRPVEELLADQPVEPDDDLVNELIEHNPAFRALLEKSLASPRKPFPLGEITSRPGKNRDDPGRAP